ncbi:Atypical PilZ domain-containing protein, cyclic di-GMP receptor [Fontimonas thermophila]|uniref:Atypical PilZ domain-containing protein, cyclic di-GMP receptor n=2 Tax=Fontimonas thermophila TaxID=1076937 RepID=A0A1I2HTV9_9GAMM|nr:Atypical PilZ domain-containing protein, cyclic di-GMP receptor [Fontimonas thermophila]
MEGLLDQWLGYRDCLPLTLEPLVEPPGTAQLAHWHEQNLRTLHVIAILDERHQRGEPGGAIESEIERLHQKLDVVLELLGAVVRARRGDLPTRPVRLSREGLSWPVAPDSPAPGTQWLASLDLHGSAPAPLCWPVQILGVHEGEVCARFVAMTDALGAAIERLVFTRHRRSVAGARSPGGGGAVSGVSRQ